MSGFGNTLKLAREQKGLSVAQVSEMTRLSQNMIEMIEQENFSLIPAPLYGRGFIKLLSQAVGLDPRPMIEQFMQLYGDGSSKPRPAAVRPAAVRPAPIAAPVAAPGVADETPPVSRPLTAEIPRTVEPPQASPKVIPPSRYAAPQPIDERPSITSVIFHELHRIPARVWRMSTLAIGAAVLATLIFFGVRALYRATSTEPLTEERMDEPAETVSTPAPEATTDTKPAEARTPEIRTPEAVPATAKPRRGTAIEPLYVD